MNASHPTAAAVAERIRAWWGIVVPERRGRALERWLDGEESSLAQRVLAGEPRARAALADWITNPETYLFRHPEHFDILRRLAASRRDAGRPLRILSAGCSSGEEAWSAAAVAADVYRDATAQVEVVGWDLSPVRVARAREATYTRWAYRAGLMGLDHFFVRDGDRIHPTPRLRRLVAFEAQNLMEAGERSGPGHDVIFFRNVAIYWPRERVAKVLAALLAALKPDGVLLVGPSDPVPLPAQGWRLAFEGGAPFIESAGTGAGLPPPLAVRAPQLARELAAPSAPYPLWSAPAPPPPELASDTPVPVLAPPSPPAPSAQPAPAPGASASSALDEILTEVQALADAGESKLGLELLASLGEVALESGAASRWQGVLHLSQDAHDLAIEALRRACYLEPEVAEHRLWLAVALDAAGRGRDAERARAHAQRLEERG